MPPICHQAQINRRVTIVAIARCQHGANDLVDVDEGMQLEAEGPALAGLAEVSARFTQQAHAPVANGFADSDGLGINQVEREFKAIRSSGGLNQMADEITELMKRF
jgi:hypothetical protein